MRRVEKLTLKNSLISAGTAVVTGYCVGEMYAVYNGHGAENTITSVLAVIVYCKEKHGKVCYVRYGGRLVFNQMLECRM